MSATISGRPPPTSSSTSCSNDIAIADVRVAHLVPRHVGYLAERSRRERHVTLRAWLNGRSHDYSSAPPTITLSKVASVSSTKNCVPMQFGVNTATDNDLKGAAAALVSDIV